MDTAAGLLCFALGTVFSPVEVSPSGLGFFFDVTFSPGASASSSSEERNMRWFRLDENDNAAVVVSVAPPVPSLASCFTFILISVATGEGEVLLLVVGFGLPTTLVASADELAPVLIGPAILFEPSAGLLLGDSLGLDVAFAFLEVHLRVGACNKGFLTILLTGLLGFCASKSFF